MSLSAWFPRLPAALLVVALVSACQSTEEQAEEHFASAQQLIAEGDTPRALVELRNAVALVPEFHQARSALAGLMLASGDLAGAYAQYTELAELQPNDLESRIALADLTLTQSMWTEFTSAVTGAERINAADPRVQALVLARDYQAAVVAGDETRRSDIAARAEALRADRPDDAALRRIAIDQAVAANQADAALSLIEAAIAAQPRDYTMQDAKLRVLLARQDPTAIEAQYRAMIAIFVGNEQLSTDFLQWYLSRQDLAGAEAFLRDRAGAPTDATEGHIAVVDFLRLSKGVAAALAELDPLIAANDGTPKADLYRAKRASFQFEQGEAEAAMAEVAAIIAAAEPSDQTRRIQTLYATMLDSQGDRATAEATVSAILAQDPSHVEALLLRAGWRIAGDRPSDAIIDLRSALNQAPNDPRLLQSLAQAYLRDGTVDLAAETLGRVVELAPENPAYARDYGRLLQEQGRGDAARSVLYRAWQRHPADAGLVQALSTIALEQEDWVLASEIITLLRSSTAPETLALAAQMESAVLLARDRFDDAMAIIDRELATTADKTAWTIVKVDALADAGRSDEAAAVLQAALAEAPNDGILLQRQAFLDQDAGRSDQAIAIYRTILAATPADEAATRELYGLLVAKGDIAGADAVLDAGLAAAPGSLDLQWIDAARKQTAGDLAGAIAIYESLYAANGGNPVIANNLASLLSVTATDAETLERALRIARRFRASPTPAFQDTYGWLLHLNGETEAALPILQSAAAGLPDLASVHYHLGAVLAELGRTDEAREALERAIAMAGDAPDPEIAQARSLLDNLSAPATPPSPAPSSTP
ncbi:tetratricopeptide repeat protein [Paragemmobacter ruber]|uniref:Tetratricopeptide repeat protein n=1 Tax=Paragemmobacter ruber TaxID=1985673 RepID=A0ABW9Y3G3_9RHOB|nr:tetratricopeptide repeat protein [Rhodobacter ruber]NBE06487.1 tetratricopeptide repeat protein [Rhodobacter ruber]